MPKSDEGPMLDPTFAAANAAYQALKLLDGADRSVAVAMLSQRLGVSVGGTKLEAVGPRTANKTIAGTDGSEPTPKDFIKGKKPLKEIERVACLAYFLVHHRGADAFNGKDIMGLNTEARGATFSNVRVHVDNATTAGYLTPVGGGKKGLTTRGAALVEALPDLQAVTAALDANPSRARWRRRGKKAKGSS